MNQKLNSYKLASNLINKVIKNKITKHKNKDKINMIYFLSNNMEQIFNKNLIKFIKIHKIYNYNNSNIIHIFISNNMAANLFDLEYNDILNRINNVFYGKYIISKIKLTITNDLALNEDMENIYHNDSYKKNNEKNKIKIKDKFNNLYKIKNKKLQKILEDISVTYNDNKSHI